jgi:hypothetical protein
MKLFNEKGLKECTKCKKHLSKENYYKDKKRKSGYNTSCKKCCAKEASKYYTYKGYKSKPFNEQDLKECPKCKLLLHKEKFNKSSKLKYGYGVYCKACCSIISKNSNYKYPLTAKKNSLKKYGLTLEQYKEIGNSQNWVCSICNKTETRKGKNGKVSPLNVDHNHKTGKARGLLCHLCNVSLGGFQDSEEILTKAINYLIKHKN